MPTNPMTHDTPTAADAAWSDLPSPHLHDDRRARQARDDAANAKAERAARRRVHRIRIDTLKDKMLDRVETLLDRLTPPSANDLPLAVARRQIANLVGAPHFCARKLCRRGHACRGEPRHCLAAMLPLLPPDTVKALALGARPTRRGRG
ncbi:MAG: hypothetical protein GC182_17965 [Rhodopseudomonas sp.]|nr:hypothetical protein [Rhodopseudomonas sp.]